MLQIATVWGLLLSFHAAFDFQWHSAIFWENTHTPSLFYTFLIRKVILLSPTLGTPLAGLGPQLPYLFEEPYCKLCMIHIFGPSRLLAPFLRDIADWCIFCFLLWSATPESMRLILFDIYRPCWPCLHPSLLHLLSHCVLSTNNSPILPTLLSLSNCSRSDGRDLSCFPIQHPHHSSTIILEVPPACQISHLVSLMVFTCEAVRHPSTSLCKFSSPSLFLALHWVPQLPPYQPTTPHVTLSPLQPPSTRPPHLPNHKSKRTTPRSQPTTYPPYGLFWTLAHQSWISSAPPLHWSLCIFCTY
jgi:hypothetical protein